MLKALLRKQFKELFNSFTWNSKNGSKRSKTGIAVYCLLYLLAIATFAALSIILSMQLCAPLAELGLDWLYFALLGTISVTVGVFVSMFTAHSTLYGAKDNDLLLSLPIRPAKILFSRLFGVWFWALFYAAIGFLPGAVYYWISVSCSPVQVIAVLVLLNIISLFELLLSCALGWIIAKINSVVRSKSIVSVVASLVFLGLYYFVYFRASELLSTFLANAQSIGASLSGWYNPIHLMGQAALGNLSALLVLLAYVLIPLALLWTLLTRSFIRLATTNIGGVHRAYREKTVKAKGAHAAFVRKELRKLTSSSTYMLNCCLPTLLMPALGIYALIKSASLEDVLAAIPGIGSFPIPHLACAAVCFLATMSYPSAPSISLEGKNIWLAQSLPVNTWTVLRAKLSMHLLVTLPPALICELCLIFTFKLSLYYALLLVFLPMLFAVLVAELGLMLNLLLPNLHWTNETAPIKQGASVGLTFLSSFLLLGALGVMCYFLYNALSPKLCLLAALLVEGVIALVLCLWLRTNGTKRFRAL